MLELWDIGFSKKIPHGWNKQSMKLFEVMENAPTNAEMDPLANESGESLSGVMSPMHELQEPRQSQHGGLWLVSHHWGDA